MALAMNETLDKIDVSEEAAERAAQAPGRTVSRVLTCNDDDP